MNKLSYQQLIHKQLFALAKEENLAASGVCSPKLPPESLTHLTNWLDKKYLAEMDWMSREPKARCDLTIKYPWAKSVLVVADNYYHHYQMDQSALKFSRYAWGRDYHKIVEKKLTRILKNLQQDFPEVEGKIFVDSGAALEKAYAVQAGLGWQGKHSLLIIPGAGTWCFLGLLLLNVNLPFNRPQPEKCGDCSLCIDTCPTKAIVSPYSIDARKCRPFLTNEKKGAFSETEKKFLENTLYGCDICQDVCPWNREWQTETSDSEYCNNLENVEKSLQQWQKLTENEFYEIFQGTAVRRLKYDRFRRNLNAIQLKSTDNK